MLLFVLLSCAGVLESLGFYSCDDYCTQVIDRTETCAGDAAADECAAAGGTDCESLSEDELAAYASQAREDWEGASRDDMLASCMEDLEASGKSDASCRAETGTINNLTCDQILDVLASLGG